MVKDQTPPSPPNPDKELQQYNQTIASSTAEVARLQRLIEAMEKNELTDELLEACPEVAAAYKKSEKLKYRKTILNRALDSQLTENKKKGVQSGNASDPKKPKLEQKKGGAPPKQAKKVDYVIVEDYASSIFGRLTDLFKVATQKAFPGVDVPVSLAEATNRQYGDYQCNSAMKLKAIVKKTPREIGEIIKDNIEPCSLIEKVEVAPAGFVNIFLKQTYIEEQILSFAKQGVQLPKIARRRVLVDFSSPNIAKEMHVGHLRSTIIGDSICRLLEVVGFDVLRVNHIGDWGTQFGMLIAHLYDTYPNFLQQPPPIADLQAFYKESKRRFDSDEAFKKRAYDCVVRLQSYQPDFVNAWKLICDVSKKYNQMVYDRLDIKINDVGESFYQDKMESLVADFKKNHPGVLREEEGRLVMFPSGCEVPLTVVKSDGGFTYDTSDLAALKYRLFEEKVDWAIYVVDGGQSLHLETIYAAGRDLGWYDVQKQRVEHVAFGLVLGEDKKKFKTRSGESVRLLDLLEEGTKRAGERLAEKKESMTEAEYEAARDAVAYGCIKYADLSNTRTNDYVFSFDRMLDPRGNTAVYMLYAYTRIRSIVRNANVSEQALSDYLKGKNALPLEHPAELKLAKQILKLSDAVLLVLDSLLLHQLCDYVYNLATVFHDFYTSCYVIENKDGQVTIHYHRLALCQVTADVIAQCFKILGIREVSKM